jgi:lipid A 3-O-deacylase PagL
MRGVEWVPHMSHIRGSHLFSLIGILALATLVATPSFAETPTLISIGPRVGFSEKTPLLGKQQKYFFHLTDVAAHFRLPWSWPLGGNSWNLETRLITSAGLLEAASDSALMVTIVPDLALSVWEGLVTFDAGAGAGFFSNYKFGTQDFGGPVQIVATLGVRVNPFSHAYAGFRLQHFSDAGVYGPSSLGVDLYIVELGYNF